MNKERQDYRISGFILLILFTAVGQLSDFSLHFHLSESKVY